MTMIIRMAQAGKSLVLGGLLAAFTLGATPLLHAEQAFKIYGKAYTVEELSKENQGQFFDVESKKFELISNLARDRYLEAFFAKLAEKDKVSVEKAKTDYLDAKTKVSDSDVKENLEKFKDYPQLKDRSDVDKKKLILDYLQKTKAQEVFEGIIAEGIAKKNLEIQYPEPKEPVYKVSVVDSDPVKYGPNAKDTKPTGCNANACPITIVEYSEFQCPFCERVQPASKRILKEYQGKIRWIVRDFPLGFHNRARPAAIAARCAKDQGKYWEMYEEMFKNQKGLSDADFKKYASNIKLDGKKFDDCVAKPNKIVEVIDTNMKSGEKLGVTGTPAFFINGRRLSGALPYEEFKKVIDSELAGK
ncbi:MAG: thioredoxin domain-containing protein [Chitinophagaceae bacterium]|nr:thioredoxin domain-containing protein [Oligoflexus sp.]